MTLKYVADTFGLLAALVGVGATYGSLNTRVKSLEDRKDQTEDVVAVKTAVAAMQLDVRESREDIKKILLRLPGRSR